jgi:CBS domain-containing protein
LERLHEFFRVGRLIPDDQEVVSVPPGTLVREALELMRQGGFDQLPVVAAGNVVGVFSYRSLARGLALIRPQDNPLDAHVDDLVEDLPFVRVTDEVSSILSSLHSYGVVLVGDETNLLAIATATDVNAFLWNATRPFVLLQDVELAVRDLMRSCTDESGLADSIAAAHVNEAKQLEDLTLGELMSVLLNEGNFGKLFRHAFGPRRDLVNTTLEPVREIRNKVFHFRDDVSAEELETLVAAVGWLRRKILIRRGQTA